MYTSIHIYIYVYVHINIHIYIRIYVCIYIYVCIPTYVYMFVYLFERPSIPQLLKSHRLKGYGDLSPCTPAGKVCISILIITSLLYLSIPFGILGSAFTLAPGDGSRNIFGPETFPTKLWIKRVNFLRPDVLTLLLNTATPLNRESSRTGRAMTYCRGLNNCQNSVPGPIVLLHPVCSTMRRKPKRHGSYLLPLRGPQTESDVHH